MNREQLIIDIIEAGTIETVRYQCAVCGKLTAGRKEKNTIYARRHDGCPGGEATAKEYPAIVHRITRGQATLMADVQDFVAIMAAKKPPVNLLLKKYQHQNFVRVSRIINYSLPDNIKVQLL